MTTGKLRSFDRTRCRSVDRRTTIVVVAATAAAAASILFDLLLGPVVALFGVSPETDQGIARIQCKRRRDHDQKFHAFRDNLPSEFVNV
jgi:hypothetical protein